MPPMSFKPLALAVLFMLSAGAHAAETELPFAAWLADLKADARSRGISDVTLEAAFAGVAPIPRVIELDRKQPEFTQTFWTYLEKRINRTRIERGRELGLKLIRDRQ